jgi:lipoyl(octanoyl) transferase
MHCSPRSNTPLTSASKLGAAELRPTDQSRRAERGIDAPRSGTTWRLLVTDPLSGAENMALDHALMWRAARENEGVIRVYAWSRPTLSFGRNEAGFRRDGVDYVRRPTGGRAILHDRELTYSFTLPATERPRALYARLNELLAGALASLGVGVTIAGRGAAAPARHGPCFAAPSPGELIYQGRKLAGSAQWRENGAVLQHGSILIDDDQSDIGGAQRPATLRQALGRAPDTRELATAFAAMVDAEPIEIEARVAEDARTLCRHYSDHAWTWRYLTGIHE